MKITWQMLVLVAILMIAVIASQLVPGGEDRTLVLIITTVLAGVFGPAAMNKGQNDKLDDQADQLAHLTEATEKVQQQTNGVLDARIRDGVRAVLEERDRTLGPPVRHDPEQS